MVKMEHETLKDYCLAMIEKMNDKTNNHDGSKNNKIFFCGGNCESCNENNSCKN